MNKKFYSFGMAAMMLLLSGNVMATDYYISANGSDTNDGKSAATAWATMARLSSALCNGDHVYVSGIIKMKNVDYVNPNDTKGRTHKNPEWSRAHLKDIVFEGTNPLTDGFDGEGENQLFNINNSIYTFKNLSFRNGKLSISEGFTGSNTDADNGNKSVGADTHAAAIWGSPLRLTLDNCIFENNISDEGNANFSAGAIYVGGNTVTNTNNEALNCGIYATNTQFINNSATVGQAGAIQLGTYGEFKNCYFNVNVAKMAGGAIMGNQLKGLTVDACAFIGNQSQTTTGGAINFYLNNQTGLTFQVSNSTFYQNKAQGNGGAFYWNQNAGSNGNTMNFVHCTVVGNSTVGTIGHSGGINIDSRACTVNVVNSLIQGNLSETNQNSYADVAFGSTTVNFVGSYVGYVRKFADNEIYYSISSSSKVNNLDGKDPRKDESKALLAYADYVESRHFFPLKSTSDATMDGDAMADAEYGVTKDQLGNAWTEFPYVGSVQLTDEDVAAGISGIKTDAPKSLKGIYNIAGQYVGNDASKLAKGLYIIGGKKVVIK